MSPPSPIQEDAGSAAVGVAGACAMPARDRAEARTITAPSRRTRPSPTVCAASERAERTNALFVAVLTLLSTVLALYDFVLLMSGI
jgi:hypothetical protein